MLSRSKINAQTTEEEAGRLWHCRYGHISNTSLKQLRDKEMVRGLPKIDLTQDVCTECLTGKQQRTAIPKASQWIASQKLEMIYADICGPITPTSSGLERYYLCFIDDYSRKAWVHFIAEK